MLKFAPRLLSVSTPDSAISELRRIGVDGCGIIEMAPKMRNHLIFLSALECRQANILKQEMLSIGGDAAVARGTVACSIDKTDCILIGTEKQYLRLCQKLLLQPFGLSQLAKELDSVIAKTLSPLTEWKTSRRILSLKRPVIMGILKVTPDSFSDGGKYSDIDAAINTALQMEADGADIIDIGGESSRPGSIPVSLDEEIIRVVPLIERLAAASLKSPISVDTWKSEVARRAISAGAEIINDISGFTFDSEMAKVAAESQAGVILMHIRGNSENMQSDTHYLNLMDEISVGLAKSVEQARNAGIADDHIAIDPGIGFGKDVTGNLEILRRLKELSGFGLPILIGPSRKSFIGAVLGKNLTDERLFGTAATVALSVTNGASIIRVHDVKGMREVADMAHAINQG